MTFKKISKFVILSIFCASFIHIPNVYASQNSDDEMGPPSPKRSKTVEKKDDNIHTYDRSIPKPNPLISSTTSLPEIDITTQFASSSAPLPPVTASTPVIASTSKRTLITDFFKAGPSVPVLTEKKLLFLKLKN